MSVDRNSEFSTFEGVFIQELFLKFVAIFLSMRVLIFVVYLIFVKSLIDDSTYVNCKFFMI